MRVSKFYLNTLKEAPAEADVMSQQLMLRAGLIKKVSSGIYSWLPLGLITLRKVEQIIREEMKRSDYEFDSEIALVRSNRICRTCCPPSCGRRPEAGTSLARSF